MKSINIEDKLYSSLDQINEEINEFRDVEELVEYILTEFNSIYSSEEEATIDDDSKERLKDLGYI